MTTRTASVLRHLRDLVAAENGDRLSDRELLERYTTAQDEPAFEALLRRHGGLVLGVCRRLLPNRQDVEDAFQATFLALARSAASIRKGESLASWLYGVAYRVAVKARAGAAARKRHEGRVAERATGDPLADVSGRELLALLDEEVQRLAARHRAPLVLCYLDGKTRDEAAQELGWSLSTLQRRLEQARGLLRVRLGRRGLGLPAGLLAAGLAGAAGAAVPARLLGATLAAAASDSPATAAAALAEGIVPGAGARLKIVALLLLAAGTAVLGAGAVGHPADAQGRPADKAPAQVKPAMPKASFSAAQPGADEPGELRVTGRVLDARGKPLGEAEVALAGSWLPRRGDGPRKDVLAVARTDATGRFSLAAPKRSAVRFESLYVLASAKGHGIGWRKRVGDGPFRPEIRLQPEQVLTATLIDLQGQPAAGARLRVFAVRDPTDDSTALALLDGARLVDARTLSGSAVVHPNYRGFEFDGHTLPKGVSFWPAPVVSDGQGRFKVPGFGRGQTLHLLVQDERFAHQELVLGGREPPTGPVSIPLAPARHLEGRVVRGDSGEPLAGARVVGRTHTTRAMSAEDAFEAAASTLHRPAPLNRTEARTDAGGRFRLPLAPGDRVDLQVFAPNGQPYLGLAKTVRMPAGAVRQTVEIALPRGVLVQGRVTEQESGKAIDEVEVYFLPLRDNNLGRRGDLLVGEGHPVFTRPDGAYRLVVPTQPGHLLCTAPGHGFIERPVSRAELYTGKPLDRPRRFDGSPGGAAVYFHALRALNFKTQSGPAELPVTLRRGVTLKGRVVAPDGKAVRAFLFCGGELLGGQPGAVRLSYLWGDLGRVVPLRGDHFELHGCDPERTYRLCFIGGPGKGERVAPHVLNTSCKDGGDRLGAVVEVSARQASAAPLTVRLQPCGAVEVRLVGDDGKPLRQAADKAEEGRSWLRLVDGRGKIVRQEPYLELLVTPARGKLDAERIALAFPFQSGGQPSPMPPDAEGWIRLGGLIPGATYCLRSYDQDAVDEEGHPRIAFAREFTARSGETVRLPDIVVPRAPEKRRRGGLAASAKRQARCAPPAERTWLAVSRLPRKSRESRAPRVMCSAGRVASQPGVVSSSVSRMT